MSANIHPPYNPEILPVRAKQLAEECRAIAKNNPNSLASQEQMKFLSAVHWVKNLSDAVLIQVIAESVPNTDITVKEIYRVESWNELVELVFDEYLDDPFRNLFQQLAIDSQVYEFEVPEDVGFEPATMVGEDDPFPMNEVSYTTHTIERKRYTAQTGLGGPRSSKTINGLAEELAHHVISDLVELIPDPSRKQTEDSVEVPLVNAVEELNCDGYHPDRVVVGDAVSFPMFNGESVNTIYGMEIKESPHLRPNSAIIADTERMGYEAVWNPGEAKTKDPSIHQRDPEIDFQPIQVGYKRLTNGIVLDEGAVKHSIV